MEATPLEHDVPPAVAAKCTGDCTVEPLDGEVTLTPANKEDTRARRHTISRAHLNMQHFSDFCLLATYGGQQRETIPLRERERMRASREVASGGACFRPGEFQRLESSKCRPG